MAKTKDQTPAAASTAITPAPDVPASALIRPPSGDEAALLAELAAAGMPVEELNTGLSEVELSDLRTPYKLFNLTKADGVARIAKDQWLDTVDRTVSDALDLVLLDMHKTNAFEIFDGVSRNVMQCHSFDRVIGTWVGEGSNRFKVGTERRCHGCPDQVWREVFDTKTNKNKREQPCCEVWNVAAFDMTTQRVCLIKFKKTSLKSIQGHIQALHKGRMPIPGKRNGDWPLCVFRVRVTLQMDQRTGNFAVPVFELVSQLKAGDMRVMHETAIGVRETFAARLRAAEESARDDVGGDASDGDTSFNTDEMDAANAKARGEEAFVTGGAT